MLYILITATVLCANAPVKTQVIQTTKARFQHDVQLIRMGWYNPLTNSRCKALSMRYSTVSE